MLKRLASQIASMMARGVLRVVDDGKARQEVQATFLKSETRDRVERLQPYGLSTHPHPSAEVFGVFIGGDRSQGLVLCVDDKRYRVKSLQQGEVVLYDDLGNTVALLRDKIQVNAVTELEGIAPLVTITAPTINITGNINLTGDIEITGNLSTTGNVSDATSSMQGMRDIYNAHSPSASGHPPGDM